MWIDNTLAYKLIENAVGDVPDDPPYFSPESGFGEGSPPTWEDEYRSTILLLLSTLYLAVRDVAEDTTLTPEQRKTRINILIDGFRTQGEVRINQQLNTIYRLGEQAASAEILGVGLYPGRGMDAAVLEHALLQQRENLQHIANAIRDNAYGQINWQTLQKQYKVPAQFQFYVNMNAAFKDAKIRLDRMASYGATVAYSEGKLNVFREFEDQITLNWITRGDSRVCPTCNFYRDNNPYKPSEFPAPPHTGCRCYPSINVKDGGGDGMDLFVLPIADTLINP
jgi:hypothetical protein